MGLLYAAPYTPPPPRGNLKSWGRVRHVWKGWDGSEWELSRPSGGVFLTADGLEGLGMPDVVQYTTSSPVVHGEQWQGWLSSGRKVYWNVGIYSDGGSPEWIRLNRAFWKTMRPGKTGVWSVELPTGEKYSLTLRFKGDGGHSFKYDPTFRGWEVYGIELFPEQPFWEGVPVVKKWESAKQVPFLGPADAGPPFFPSPATTLGTAELTNPGDVESYIRWTISGPTDTVTVGIGGENTVIPFPVPDGKKLVIDTDPRTLTAELDGVDVMAQLREFNYPALPPGEDVKLSLSMEASGENADRAAVEARFTPYYLMGL